MFGFVLLQAQLPPMPGPPSLPPPLPEGMAYADATVWLGVVVACAALVVTAVGVWVGLMAIWGYRTFQEELQERTGQVARETTLAHVQGAEVKGWLKIEAQGILSDLFREWKESQDIAASQPAQSASTVVEEEKEKVGRRRRKAVKEG